MRNQQQVNKNSGQVNTDLVEVGVQVLSRNHDVVDTNEGGFALVPTKDFILFLKLPKDELRDAVIIQKVREKCGKNFLAKSWWRVVTDEFPF